MSERGCIKCGYNLAGLPAAGTVVTCPECGQANDLAISRPARVNVFAPFLWAMIPWALCVVCMHFDFGQGGSSKRTKAFLAATALISGAITAGILTYTKTGREPERGRPPRTLWARLALSVCAVVASVVVNALLMFVILAVEVNLVPV